MIIPITTLFSQEINDVNLVSACAPPGGGRNKLSGRLLKYFNVFALPQPSAQSLQHIYQVQLGQFFNESGDFSPEVSIQINYIHFTLFIEDMLWILF